MKNSFILCLPVAYFISKQSKNGTHIFCLRQNLLHLKHPSMDVWKIEKNPWIQGGFMLRPFAFSGSYTTGFSHEILFFCTKNPSKTGSESTHFVIAFLRLSPVQSYKSSDKLIFCKFSLHLTIEYSVCTLTVSITKQFVVL